MAGRHQIFSLSMGMQCHCLSAFRPTVSFKARLGIMSYSLNSRQNKKLTPEGAPLTEKMAKKGQIKNRRRHNSLRRLAPAVERQSGRELRTVGIGGGRSSQKKMPAQQGCICPRGQGFNPCTKWLIPLMKSKTVVAEYRSIARYRGTRDFSALAELLVKCCPSGKRRKSSPSGMSEQSVLEQLIISDLLQRGTCCRHAVDNATSVRQMER